MMRRAIYSLGLACLGLAAPVVRAQVPADSSDAERDSVVVSEIVHLERAARPQRVVRQLEARMVERIDTVRVQGEASARFARLAFPTEGGVFYYRAGSGTAFQRVRPERPVRAAAPSRPVTARVAPVPAPVSAPPRAPARAGDAAAPTRQPTPSGVTQGDLDRLERRLLEAMNRRLDREARARQPVPLPAVVPPAQAGEDRPAEQPADRPAIVPVPVSPGDSLRRVPRSSLADDPGVNTDPEVTPEVVERAILDTGLFRTSRVFFAFGEADLLPVSRGVLDTISDVLLRYPELRIEVGGHTDAISSDAFNLELSQRRAASVVDYLVASGIDRRQLEAVGYGEARPVATNETETGRALNRRVEFVVLEVSGQ